KHRRSNAKTERGEIRPRLESPVTAKLLRLSPMSKTIPPPCLERETGPKYWRSLDQLADTPEFHRWVEREFPAGASELTDPVTRRHFMKIMSASFLLAGLGSSGCRRPEEKILPFGKAPENYVHGLPQFFATGMQTRGGGVRLVVKSSDGRPTKSRATLCTRTATGQRTATRRLPS